MTLLQRLLQVLAGLLSGGVGLLLLAVATGWLRGDWLLRPLESLLSVWRLQLWALGLVGLAIGLATVLSGVSRRSDEGPVVTETELGRVAISRKAVEKLVERAARRVQGVRDVRVDLLQTDQGLEVSLVLGVAADVPLPTVSHEVQSGVESYLRQTGGLDARRVNVEIRQVAHDEARESPREPDRT